MKHNISAKIQPSAMMLCFVTIVTMVCLISSYNCYAKTETVLIELKCSKNYWKLDENSKHYYPSDKKVKYSLTTIGMKTTTTGDELITNWYEKPREYAAVYATCGGMAIPMIPMNMLPIERLPFIACHRDQSLAVELNHPIDPNPDAYRYYGLITIDSEDDEENQEVKNIVIKQDNDQSEKFLKDRALTDNSNNNEEMPLLGKYKKLMDNYKLEAVNVIHSYVMNCKPF